MGKRDNDNEKDHMDVLINTVDGKIELHRLLRKTLNALSAAMDDLDLANERIRALEVGSTHHSVAIDGAQLGLPGIILELRSERDGGY